MKSECFLFVVEKWLNCCPTRFSYFCLSSSFLSSIIQRKTKQNLWNKTFWTAIISSIYRTSNTGQGSHGKLLCLRRTAFCVYTLYLWTVYVCIFELCMIRLAWKDKDKKQKQNQKTLHGLKKENRRSNYYYYFLCFK